ncbi:MAG TPA: serine hydrolase domain-containing protein [Gemmatimonadaceae bacterium]
MNSRFKVVMAAVAVTLSTGLLEAQVSGCSSPATRHASKRTADRLATAVDRYADSIAATGLSGVLLVGVGDSVRAERGFGAANRDRCIAISSSTLIDIGSIAKTFTAIGIARLIEQGRIRETGPLSRFFQNVPDDKSTITVRQLLTHTSGLQSFHDTAGDFEVMSRNEAIRRIFSDSLKFAPGTKESYSNSGYTLLAMIGENVTGLGWQQYLRDSVFRRAGLRDTWFWSESGMPHDRVALGYLGLDARGDPSKWPLTWASVGGAGIVMSARDLFRFSRAIEKGVLVSAAMDKAMQEHPLKKWAEGWEVSETPYGKLVMKGGASEFGFTSQLRRYVDRDVTVILLLNTRRNDKDYPHVEVGPGLSDVVFSSLR